MGTIQLDITEWNQLKQDAAKWRALVACSRITCMGSAGLVEPRADHYCHATFNYWTTMNADYKDDEQGAHGREAFEKFIQIAMKAHP